MLMEQTLEKMNQMKLSAMVEALEQAPMKADLIAVTFQYRASKIVVEYDSGNPSPVGAGSTAAGGSVICHAPFSATFSVGPLTLAMIGPDFRILLITAVDATTLFAPHPIPGTHPRSRPGPDNRLGR